MTMTGPIVDMLTYLYNASPAYHESVNVPCSKIKAIITNILQTEGYIRGYQAEGAQVGRTLVLNLKYGTKRKHAISGMRRVSRPGLRVYVKSNKLPKIMGGLGMAITSSPFGLLTDREVADKGVGREVVTYIW